MSQMKQKKVASLEKLENPLILTLQPVFTLTTILEIRKKEHLNFEKNTKYQRNTRTTVQNRNQKSYLKTNESSQL